MIAEDTLGALRALASQYGDQAVVDAACALWPVLGVPGQPGSDDRRWTLWQCPACSHVGIEGVPGGVGPWPGDGKVRCPSRACEYRTPMERAGALALVRS